MVKKLRVRVRDDGSVAIPRELQDRLEWSPGSYIEVDIAGETIQLKRVRVDPFEEVGTPSDPDEFERRLVAEAASKSEAAKRFEELMRNPPEPAPELAPEDHPDHWR